MTPMNASPQGQGGQANRSNRLCQHRERVETGPSKRQETDRKRRMKSQPRTPWQFSPALALGAPPCPRPTRRRAAPRQRCTMPPRRRRSRHPAGTAGQGKAEGVVPGVQARRDHSDRQRSCSPAPFRGLALQSKGPLPGPGPTPSSCRIPTRRFRPTDAIDALQTDLQHPGGDDESLSAGATTPPDGALQGSNIRGPGGAYAGPHPPAGGPVHHYHFQVFALDTALDLPQGVKVADLVAAMKGHVLASGELVGTYQGPPKPAS